MALCRSFLHFNSPLQRIHTATLLFPNCPPRLQKFPSLSLPAPLYSLSSSSMDTPPEGYRKNGGIDESEDPRNAVIRELREETGVTSADIVAEVPYWLTYDFPPEVREKLKQQWGSDWKGQAQKWFLLKFTGKDEEVNLLGDGTEKAEFGQWSWMSPQEIVDHVSLLSDRMETV
ncbi:hypothetical protein DH2020_010485 [Rehmannia glutinosa]|uniref:Nudix hydrolase domain-containing protein n=1 Tax=Rehmannia glutinosa TaxID=99300 RepID=A0ABR0XAS8_REHGL